jgi:dolichol-phosphate mannosyltransferase
MLCIVTSCYNEEDVVDLFYETLRDELLRLENIDYRILFVDDGSQDSTLKRLNAIAQRDEAVSVYSLSRNFGHQIALSAGLEHADGDAVVMMDCDLQHPPALIPRMVELWRQGNEVVSALRTSTDGTSPLKRWTSGVFYWLINRLGDTHIVPGVADFCLLSRAAHQAICAMPERHRFLRGMVSWIGFQRACVPFEAPARVAGRTKYTLVKMIRLALDATFSFSAAPIKIATRMGFVVVLLATCYFLYVLARWFIVGDLVTGWGSIICTILIVGGAQLVFIGLIGEYLIRLFEESKARPLYIMKQQPVRGEQDSKQSSHRPADREADIPLVASRR